MRFMIIGKATAESEKEGALPDPQLMAEMGEFNEELVKAGILLASDGLHPSSKGARVRFSGKSRTVIDGPFTEAKELIAGFQIWQVKSSQRPSSGSSAPPTPRTATPKSKFARSLRWKISHPSCPKSRSSTKSSSELSCQIRPPTNSRSCTHGLKLV